MLTLSNNTKINGCISIKRFAPGEKIFITQQASLILKSAKAGKHEDIILEATRGEVTHTIIVTKFPKGEHLYKIKKFSPAPKL